MRKIVQLAVSVGDLYVVCADGTLWKRSENVGEWQHIEGPPEGKLDQKELTLEEQAERLRQKGGRQMVIGKGKQT